ncbi:hypothetical protein, partial [Pantoea coffeiphila]
STGIAAIYPASERPFNGPGQNDIRQVSSQHPFGFYNPRVYSESLTCGLTWFAILLIALATTGPDNFGYCLMSPAVT